MPLISAKICYVGHIYLQRYAMYATHICKDMLCRPLISAKYAMYATHICKGMLCMPLISAKVCYAKHTFVDISDIKVINHIV